MRRRPGTRHIFPARVQPHLLARTRALVDERLTEHARRGILRTVAIRKGPMRCHAGPEKQRGIATLRAYHQLRQTPGPENTWQQRVVPMQQRRGARPRNGRRAAARAPSRGGAFFEAVRRGRSRSPLLAGAAARPAPSKLQSRNRERPRGSSVMALARVPHPPATSPQGHPRNDKQEWLVSAPGLHHPRAQAGGHCPRRQAPA
jgi:hypothetical protein